jgi:integrase
MKLRVRHGTFEPYSGLVRSHITPAIGYMLLAKLSPSSLQHFYMTFEAKGLSARTRRAIHARIISALKSAVQLAILGRNVAEMVTAPRYAAPEVALLSLAEVRRLLAAARSERLYALFLLAVSTAARQGELFAIRRRDIDLRAGTLSIDGTLKEDGSISPESGRRYSRRRI